MALVAGIDSSTQATKVEIRDADSGSFVSSGRAPHPPTSPPRSEQDPESWWTALQAAWSDAGSPTVEAISVAGQQHGMVVTDELGTPLRPAKLWNDTETAADASWLIKKLGSTGAWAEAVGSVPVASFTITKLSWLHRTEADVWARMARVCLPHDWLTWRLTGRLATDRGDASGTGYWSPAGGEYRFDLLEIVGDDVAWPSVVPPVLAPDEPAGYWGDGAGGPVVACGTGDNMAAALGVGLGPGQVALSIGTSGTAYVVSDRPTADSTGAVAGFADATGRFLPLVCTLNAAKVTDAIARLIGVDHDRLDRLALDAPPGAGGLTLLPWFDGERTPNRPDATGTLVGLRTHLDRRDGRTGVGAPVAGARIVLVGGGSRSSAYQRVVADLSGQVVEVHGDEEQVAKGACVQAAAALHSVSPAEIAAAWKRPPSAEIEPDPEVDRDAIRAAYAALRDAS